MGENALSKGRAASIFFLIWAVLLGGLVRLAPLSISSMPLEDGGLFYVIAQDIQEADFRLPETSSFNDAEIPFVYPPFGLYVAALLGKVFPLLQVVRWLPAIISVLTIIPFYSLSRKILPSEVQAGLATVAFAMLPSAYFLTIQGGGLTRSFGLLFSILTLEYSYRLFKEPTPRYILMTAIAAAFLVLAHPLATAHTLLSVIVFWIFVGRDKKSAFSALQVAALVVIFTAPWWINVLGHHGIAPFLNGTNTVADRFYYYTALIRLDIGNEFLLDLIVVIAILGIFISLARRQYFFLIWIIAIHIIGREAELISSLPLAMCAGLGLGEVVFRSIQFAEFSIKGKPEENITFQQWFEQSAIAKIALTFFLFYTAFNALAFSFTQMNYVTGQEQQALAWVTENTPSDSQFLVLTRGDVIDTPLQEWFPALTGRTSLTVTQGYEWFPDGEFSKRQGDYFELQKCLTKNLDCVENWVSERGYQYDYIYVYQGYISRETLGEIDLAYGDWLLEDLYNSSSFELVYDEALIKIFAHH